MQCWIWPTTPKTHPKYWRHGAQGLMGKWCNGKGYGLFINESGHIELRINGKKVTTGAPVRDHAWHFIAATYDAETGEAVSTMSRRSSMRSIRAIPPVKTKLGVKIQNATGVPFTVACYTGALDDGPLAKSSKPAGIVMAGHYNGKIDSPRLCKEALSRQDIETMKLGAQPGLTERRHCGPTGELAEVIVGSWDFSDGINTIIGKGPWSLSLRSRDRELPDSGDDRS